MEIQAAVMHEANKPLTIETIDIDEPADREVLFRVVASGVCHSDLHVADGTVFAGRPPLVLGHEGAGIVEAVGPGVTHVAPGDHVVSCLSGFCGTCPQCLSGHPNVCTAGLTARRPRGAAPRLSQGDQRVGTMAGIGAFAEKVLVHENSLVAIDPDLAFDTACLVGCGVLTGVGAALRTAPVRAGDTVAVFGCGGVGLSIVQGAALAGAARIIAIDRMAEKLELAQRLGATDVVDASGDDTGSATVEAVRAVTGGRGVDHAFEAVGLPALVRQATESLAVRGTCVIVGVPPDGTVYEIPYAAIRPECVVKTCRMGSNQFRTDIPRYLEFARSGRLNLDDMISEHRSLADVNDAFDQMRAGVGARTVLMFDDPTSATGSGSGS
jgi:S-(hydroxymethyl)glutathione dehydrogenase/alcohol dehydrogenase